MSGIDWAVHWGWGYAFMAFAVGVAVTVLYYARSTRTRPATRRDPENCPECGAPET